MGKRGRPKHPDILTPREWEVLDLLRDGLSNEEIAQRLSISVAGAKYHVSEILSKLAVASREEAAAWQPERRRWPLAAFAPLAFWRRANVPWLSTAAAGVAGAAVVAGIVLLVWGLVRTSGDGNGNGQLASDGPLSPPAQPLRPEDVPFEFVGPLDLRDALTEEHADRSGLFVLDLPTGSIYILVSPQSSTNEQLPHVSSIRWVDDESLHIETLVATNEGGLRRDRPGPAYLVRLDGTVFFTPPSPLRPPDWQEGVASPDGEWTATQVGAPWDGTAEGSFDTLLVGRPNEEPSFRAITGSGSSTWWPPAWAPDGHLLAFTGNVCRGHDLFVFDPEKQELRNLTSSLENQVLRFTWRPDGSSLVASVSGSSRQPSTLELIDLATGSTKTLLESPELGLALPIEWNPSGNRLLFGFNQVGWCEGVGFDFPVPPPTALEILRD